MSKIHLVAAPLAMLLLLGFGTTANAAPRTPPAQATAASGTPSPSEHNIGIAASDSCTVDYDTLSCETSAVPASGGKITIVISKPIAVVPCNYVVTDAANGKRVRDDTFWYGNFGKFPLTNVYSSYRLRLWGCSPFTSGIIGT